MQKQDMLNNQQLYEKIYKKYSDDVYRLSVYLTKDKEKAKEITLYAFEQLFKECESIDEAYRFAYLVQKVKSYEKEADQEKSKEEEVK